MTKKYKNIKNNFLINTNGACTHTPFFLSYLNTELFFDFFKNNFWKKNVKNFEKQEQKRKFILKYSFFK